MKPEQLHSDHEGDPWADKEYTRTEGYRDERSKQTKKMKKEDDENAKQERINKTAANLLKKLNKKPEASSTEKNPDEFKLT